MGTMPGNPSAVDCRVSGYPYFSDSTFVNVFAPVGFYKKQAAFFTSLKGGTAQHKETINDKIKTICVISFFLDMA